MKQDVLLHIIGIIDRHGAEVAFPTSTVQVPDRTVAKAVPADRVALGKDGTPGSETG